MSSVFPELEQLPKEDLGGMGDPTEKDLRRLQQGAQGHELQKGKHQRHMLAQLTFPGAFLCGYMSAERPSSN